jgi:carboxymethylenebutenolidase
MELVSRTIGPDRVVDEFIFEFVHDMEIDWMWVLFPMLSQALMTVLGQVTWCAADRKACSRAICSSGKRAGG